MNPKLPTFILILLAVGLFALAAVWGGHSPGISTGSKSSALTSDAPPGVRFVSVALGGFRGLLADILWLRAANLQDEGKFFEVAQLSDWITRLEPRYPEVWAYHAWNMAYNITAVVADPADRWHWVKNGLRLLRDEGIPSTPSSAKLYWELGWTFYDKVGGRWDEATLYYRTALADDITSVLGGGLANYPLLERQPEKVAPLLASVGLNLEGMKALDQAYGSLDWRLPETHAMYWGYRGRTLSSRDAIWCDRLVWMALTETLRGGALMYLPECHRYQRGPQLEVTIKALRRCVVEKPPEDSLVSLAMHVFLKDAALYLYAFQRPVEAGIALQQLKEKFPDELGGLTPEAFIQKEVAGRLRGLEHAVREKLVVDQLVQSDIWRRLAVPEFAEGYSRLARLYWTGIVGADGSEKNWQALQQNAQDRSLQEMP